MLLPIGPYCECAMCVHIIYTVKSQKTQLQDVTEKKQYPLHLWLLVYILYLINKVISGRSFPTLFGIKSNCCPASEGLNLASVFFYGYVEPLVGSVKT